MTRAIEPSEILTNQDGTFRALPIAPNPWFRFLARFTDYSLFFLGLLALEQWRHFSLFSSSIVPLEYFFWVPVETLLLWALRTTPGKWLLAIDLRQGRLRRLPLLTCLKRSLFVWFRGLGLGIPFVNVACMLVAYYRLRMFQTTSWDREEHCQVIHRKIGPWRYGLGILIALGGHVVYFQMKV